MAWPSVSPDSPGALSLLANHARAGLVAWREGQLLSAETLTREASVTAARLPLARPGEEALITCGDPWAFAVGLIAAWQRGYAIALPPNLQPQTLSALRSQPGLSALLHDGAFGHDAQAVDVREGGQAVADFPSALTFAPETHVATLYTSGTTGESLPCRKSARQLLGEARFQATFLGVGPGARILVTAPPQHIYGFLMGLLTPLTGGGAFVCGRALLPEAVAALARSAEATHLASVPAHLRALAARVGAAGDELRGVRTFVSSGAPLESDVASQIVSGGARLVELLGSTETGGIATRSPPAELWTPLPGVTVSADATGHMLVDSPFIEHPGVAHLTSDLIAMRAAGRFEHRGRADGVIKVGGRRIALQEIEQSLRALKGVEDAAVAAYPSTAGRLVELWAMVAGADLTPAILRQHLLTRFDPVVVPRRFRILKALPREPSGKLTKAAWLATFGADASPRPPVTEVEMQSRRQEQDDVEARCEIRFVVPEALSYLRGHFDGFPILSGIFILQKLVVAESRRAWPDLGAVRGLVQVKFRRPIFPRAEVDMSLRRRGRDSEVTFALRTGARECTSGSVQFSAQREGTP